MNLDLLTYGNPTQDQLPYLFKESYLDSVLDELSQSHFPRNSSQATKEELNQIVDYLKLMDDETIKSQYLNRYIGFDRNLKKFFKDGLIKAGDEEEKVSRLIDGVVEDIKPLIMKLKYHYQRPRPYQLAEYYKLKLFPYKSISADSPSFPSGHAFEGRILTEVVGNLYPSTYSFMQNIFQDICYSRVYLGLHYQSDVDYGIQCADKVLQNSDFKKKYAL